MKILVWWELSSDNTQKQEIHSCLNTELSDGSFFCGLFCGYETNKL